MKATHPSPQSELTERKEPVDRLTEDASGEPFLRSKYLPKVKLIAQKAPASLPLRCSGQQCPTKHLKQFFRCKDCYGGRVLCSACVLSVHTYLPYHQVETWIDNDLDETWLSPIWKPLAPPRFGYFRRIPLRDVGLRVPLGHQGAFCPSSHPSDEHHMSVFHINGYHKVRFQMCKCGGKELWELLLEVGIFPATEKNPQTGFTIPLLKHQRACSLHGKTSHKEYHRFCGRSWLCPGKFE